MNPTIFLCFCLRMEIFLYWFFWGSMDNSKKCDCQKKTWSQTAMILTGCYWRRVHADFSQFTTEVDSGWVYKPERAVEQYIIRSHGFIIHNHDLRRNSSHAVCLIVDFLWNHSPRDRIRPWEPVWYIIQRTPHRTPVIKSRRLNAFRMYIYPKREVLFTLIPGLVTNVRRNIWAVLKTVV